MNSFVCLVMAREKKRVNKDKKRMVEYIVATPTTSAPIFPIH